MPKKTMSSSTKQLDQQKEDQEEANKLFDRTYEKLAQQRLANDELRDIVSDLLMLMFKQDSKIMTGETAIELLARAHVAGAIHVRPKGFQPPEDVWVNQFEHFPKYDFGGIYDTEEGAIDARKSNHLQNGGGRTLHYKLAD